MYQYNHCSFLSMYQSSLNIRYNLSSRYTHYMYHRSHRNLSIQHNHRSLRSLHSHRNHRSLHSCYILSIRYSYHRNCSSNHHHRSLRNCRIHQNHHSRFYIPHHNFDILLLQFLYLVLL